jgi:serine/threonine protein kinase/tetratricopeptide (TPR) repeat protein
MQEKPGMMIGRYRLLQEIGKGGFGIVFRAEETGLVRREVALKLIKAGMDTREILARFEAERQALALMDHPNIARVLDGGGTASGRPYFVMELVRGIPITDYCDQGSLSTRARLELFIKVCRAVQHAHQKAVIHRDLKPSNVLVTAHDGESVPKVIDFGVAKALGQKLTEKTLFTRSEQLIGTPAYMSPEQAALGGLDIDTRSDMYSLGVMLYELLTGVTPLDSETLRRGELDDIRRMIRETDPPTPSTRLQTMGKQLAEVARCRKVEPGALGRLVRGDLDWITMKALEKDRQRRYETVNGLARDIERHLSNEPVVARPPSQLYRFQKFVRRNKLEFAAAVGISVVLLVGIVVSAWEALRARRAEGEQSRSRQQAQTAAIKSQQEAQFLKNMLESVGPSKARGRDTAMLREILDQTAERIGRELTNQPAVEIELREILARTYEELGMYQRMEEMARERLRISRAQPGQESLDVAGALDQLGLAQRYLGNLPEAERLTRDGLALRQKLLGTNSHDVAVSLNDVGLCLWEQGKLPEAETALRQAVEINCRVLGHDDLEVAVNLNNLANILNTEEKLAEAETVYREALALRRKLLPSEHPALAQSIANLATVLYSADKLDEAERLCQESLGLARRMLGSNHVDLIAPLHTLTAVLEKRGKWADAEGPAQEALAIAREDLGQENDEVAGSLFVLATVVEGQGKLQDAEAFYRQTLELRRKLLSEDHPLLGVSVNYLATLLVKEGKLPEAETFCREALTRARNFRGDTHPDVAIALNDLANVLRDEGKVPEAETDYREALAMRRKLFGYGDRRVAETLNNLAAVLQRQGRVDEVEALWQEELQGARAALPADDPKLAGVLARLSVILLSDKKFAAAEAAAREALTIREQKIPDDWVTFNSRGTLGACLVGQQRYSEAEPLLRAAYEGMKQRQATMPANRQVRLKEAVQNLVQLYQATGLVDEAAEWRSKLQEIDQAQGR